MRLIFSSEFMSRFPENQKVIFVGNAPSLKNQKLGTWIDSHDIVVRFNESPVAGYEDDVGSKSDIIVANPYLENPKPIQLSDHGIIVIISPQTRRLPSEQLEKWVTGHPVLFTYSPDLVQVGEVDHLATLTTGTYGIHLLSRLLNPSSVSVTGFTMFLDTTAHHYWSNTTPKGVSGHDLTTEAAVFIKVCNSTRCPLTVTGDIEWVSQKIRLKLKGNTKVIPVSNMK